MAGWKTAFPVEMGIRISEEQRELIQEESEYRGMALTAVVRLALDQFFAPRLAERRAQGAREVPA